MKSSFTAAVRQNPGRRYLIVDFRHPLRPDPSNQSKPGRKVRKGLGTADRSAAEALVEELNRLLADPALHSPAARIKAKALFDPRVVEIFYEGIEPRKQNYRALRDKHLPFPPREDGYPRVLLLGVPGAGKTTLVRQLIGSHPDDDRFPSTSVNRTTTCETEVIVGPKEFAAAVTFMSEEEADFEIQQSVSGAVLRAIETTSDADVAKVLLERSDMRFRLKYMLGDWPSRDVEDDPYQSEAEEPIREPDRSPLMASPAEAKILAERLHTYVATIRDITVRCRHEVENLQAPLDTLSSDDRTTALDWIQELAEQSDAYATLVSDILDDFRTKFDGIPFGRLSKTTTGWPRLWEMSKSVSKRKEFLAAVRFFSGIDRRYWGKLFTPLVTGIRVAGPFAPIWATSAESPRLVLIDTEGLGHKADPAFDVPDHIVARFPESDVILLVQKGDAPFSFEGGKALEAIGGAGQSSKTLMVFSRMEEVKGDNIKGWQAKRDYAFNGVRNVINNQIAKSLTQDVARFMLTHLEQNAFYLGLLQNANPEAARDELSALLYHLKSVVPSPPLTQTFPEYSFDLLVLALQKGVENFRIPWRAYLGLEPHSEVQPLPWQSVKAVSRRYAEGFDDGYHIRPASKLLNTMTLAIARFLENPVRWEGNPSLENKRFVLDRIKATVSQKLAHFCPQQLRESPQLQWQEAYAFRGTGSTFDRKLKIEALYERWVPIPANEADDMQHVQEFIDTIKQLVKSAIDTTRDDLVSETVNSSDDGT